MECITKCRTQKQILSTDSGGLFQPIADVQKKYEDDPEELESILANGQRMTCPIRGKELILVPEYKLNLRREDTEELDRKRQIEGEMKIKKAKKAKPALVAPGDEPGEVEIKTIPDNQLQRLGNSLEKLGTSLLGLEGVLTTATSADIVNGVPQMWVAKASL